MEDVLPVRRFQSSVPQQPSPLCLNCCLFTAFQSSPLLGSCFISRVTGGLGEGSREGWVLTGSRAFTLVCAARCVRSWDIRAQLKKPSGNSVLCQPPSPRLGLAPQAAISGSSSCFFWRWKSPFFSGCVPDFVNTPKITFLLKPCVSHPLWDRIKCAAGACSLRGTDRT